MKPVLLVIAGPNGSGKTTITERLRNENWSEETLLAQHKGIAFETVFSAPDKVAFVARAREAGYFIRLFFVGTTDPRINASRVAARVIEGGHDVPIPKIVSRYDKSMANLALAAEIADRVYAYDNSVEGAEALLCARTRDGELRKVYGPLPQWVDAALGSLPRSAGYEDMRGA